MKLVKFKNLTNGKDIYINSDKITFVEPDKNFTLISCDIGNYFIDESYSSVISKLTCEEKKVKSRWTSTWFCSGCGEHAPLHWNMSTGYYRSKFCPNCGARMENGNVSDD